MFVVIDLDKLDDGMMYRGGPRFVVSPEEHLTERGKKSALPRKFLRANNAYRLADRLNVKAEAFKCKLGIACSRCIWNGTGYCLGARHPLGG